MNLCISFADISKPKIVAQTKYVHGVSTDPLSDTRIASFSEVSMERLDCLIMCTFYSPCTRVILLCTNVIRYVQNAFRYEHNVFRYVHNVFRYAQNIFCYMHNVFRYVQKVFRYVH